MIRIFFIVIYLTLLAACLPKKETIPNLPPVHNQTNRVVIYQLMVRLFGNKLTVNKPFGTLAENGCGKMNDINDAALKSIKELGATHIWYTGIIEHASCTAYPEYGIAGDDPDVVKGVAGSPYSIRDYYDVHPDLAINVPNRIKEFEELVQRTHHHGLKVIIDFVPNHVARSYRSDAKPRHVRDLGEDDNPALAFAPTNNFYYLPGQRFVPPVHTFKLEGMDGRFDEYPAKVTANDVFSPTPAAHDWYEAVKLNYGVNLQAGGQTFFDPVPDTWLKMRDILLYWTDKGVDGFRCDVAWMVPVAFWSWVIPQVKAKKPDLLFIAEIYQPDLYRTFLSEARFDYLYDKVQLYDTLRLLIEGKTAGQAIVGVQQSLQDISKHLLHFMENHDEQRIASPYFAGDPWKGLPAMVVSAAIDNGALLIYFGQEVGEPADGDPGFQTLEKRGVTTKMDYWGVTEHQKWMNGGAFDGGGLTDDQKKLRQAYARLLHAARTEPALTDGIFVDLTTFNAEQKTISPRVVVFLRATASEKILVVAGFNSQADNITVDIPDSIMQQINLQKHQTYALKDLLSDAEATFDGTLKLTLKPYGYHLFKFQ
jgi:glycosidase